VLFVAFEPCLRRIRGSKHADGTNIYREIKASMGLRLKTLTTEHSTTGRPAKILSLNFKLKYEVYSLKTENPKQTKGFDGYVPCKKERRSEKHVGPIKLDGLHAKRDMPE
jgi:hypothetical protein